MEINATKSFIKSLYFHDSPRLKNKTVSPKRTITVITGETPTPGERVPRVSTNRSISGSKNHEISSIHDPDQLKIEEESYKKKLRAQYLHMPIYLPNIVKDKFINETKQTMQFFTKDKDYSEADKKITLPFLGKQDNIKSVKNAKKFNENFYISRQNKKEDTSKMLINELWNKSYQKKVLDLSGLKMKQEKMNSQKIQSFEKRYKELGGYFEPKQHSYLKFLTDNEKNVSDLINFSVDSRKPNIESFIRREDNSSSRMAHNHSKFFKSEIGDLLDRCKEYNDLMKKEKK